MMNSWEKVGSGIGVMVGRISVGMREVAVGVKVTGVAVGDRKSVV